MLHCKTLKKAGSKGCSSSRNCVYSSTIANKAWLHVVFIQAVRCNTVKALG